MEYFYGFIPTLIVGSLALSTIYKLRMKSGRYFDPGEVIGGIVLVFVISVLWFIALPLAVVTGILYLIWRFLLDGLSDKIARMIIERKK